MNDGIAPDTKNWTWVLEKRCDDCGVDASQSGPAARDLSDRWRVVLAGPDVGVRPRPDVWSPLEYGCHVRDVFRLFDECLALMLTEDDPRFANGDQDATAIEDDYASQDARVVAVQLAEAAGSVADHLDAVGAEQWERRGFRSDGSAFTVESLGRYLMHDPVHHLWNVDADVSTYG